MLLLVAERILPLMWPTRGGTGLAGCVVALVVGRKARDLARKGEDGVQVRLYRLDTSASLWRQTTGNHRACLSCAALLPEQVAGQRRTMHREWACGGYS